MKRHNHSIYWIFILANWLFLFHSLDAQELHKSDSITIAIISDTQSPMWFESIVVSKNRNEEATSMLFHHIAQDTSVVALVHLGDVTECSSRDGAWKRIDTLLALLERRNVALYGTMGNHDYMYSASAGEENFKKRFPSFQRKGFLVRIHSLAIVMLNSNFSNLADNEIKEQVAWYHQQLDQLEHDTTVSAVFVACHHPPFTNSTVVPPSKECEEEFVPQFLFHKKCKIFFSGHSHAFEHFNIEGKNFLIIGGGGGLQHPLLIGKEQRWNDLFPLQTEKRMFHYLRVVVTREKIECTVMMIKKDFSGIEPVYVMTLPLP